MRATIRNIILLLAANIGLLTSCEFAFPIIPETTEKEPLDVPLSGNQRHFEINVSYISQNELGLMSEVSDINAKVLLDTINGQHYCRWYDYRIRSYKVNEPVPGWTEFSAANGFDYYLPIITTGVNYLDHLPNLDAIPKDLDGFKFYVNLIDFHMWELLAQVFLNAPVFLADPGRSSLTEIGDSLQLDFGDVPIPLIEWPGLSTDGSQTMGDMYGEYIGDAVVDGENTKLLQYRQEQKLFQLVYSSPFVMPFNGTNRFSGFINYKPDNSLKKAEYHEYVYGRVDAPSFVTVMTHTERVYAIKEITP